MSRRNRIPRRESALPGLVKIRVVCTDGGQHEQVSFGAVTVWPSAAGGWRVKADGLEYRGDEYTNLDAPSLTPQGRLGKTYPLRCRRCGRNVPLRADSLERIFAALAQSGKAKLDISLI